MKAGSTDRPETRQASQPPDIASGVAANASGAQTADSAPSTVAPARPRFPPRIWPAVLLLAIFWGYSFGVEQVELSSLVRFLSRMAVHLGLLLGFLAWWFSNGRLPRTLRLGAAAAIVAGEFLAKPFCDASLNGFAMTMLGLPFVFTAWTVWFWLSRERPARTQFVGVCVVSGAVWGCMTLLRWDGLSGGQQTVMSWRWTPTPEQEFLTSISTTARTASHELPARELPAGGAKSGDTSLNGATLDGATPADDAPSERSDSVVGSVVGSDSDAGIVRESNSLRVQVGDWPEFRGPNRDGRVVGLNLATDWNTRSPKKLWGHRVGPGWSSMIVVDGRLCTQEQRGDLECVVCYDAVSGEELWSHADPERFVESLSGAGPRGTPTFADGRIFTLGGRGRLNALDAATGKRLWTHDIAADSGANAPQWGFSGSPLLIDGLVIVFAGGDGPRSCLAYQQQTGDLAWAIDAGKTSYSSPQVIDYDGRRLIGILSDHSLAAAQPSDGAIVWQYPLTRGVMVPVTQPQTAGDRKSFVVQSAEGLARIEPIAPASPPAAAAMDTVAADANATDASAPALTAGAASISGVASSDVVAPGVERWWSKGLKTSLSDFVIDGNAIYGFDDGIFCCLDLESGERRWKKGRFGHGQVLLFPEQHLLLLTTESGEAILLAANPAKLIEFGRFCAVSGKTWNVPAVAQGRLYVRNGEEMACFELPATVVR